MARKRTDPPTAAPTRAPGVPMRAIRKLAREIAEKFHPEKIILFGSHAYGTPHEDSDVDLLVVMPARNMIDQAARIRMALPLRLFSLDLIVRTPHVRSGLEGENWFIREIVGRGTVLYEARDASVDRQGRERLARREPPGGHVEPA